jgi:hypothetical protein
VRTDRLGVMGHRRRWQYPPPLWGPDIGEPVSLTQAAGPGTGSRSGAPACRP